MDIKLNIKRIDRSKRDAALPFKWEGICTCGWSRNFGGMEITAQRESERHEESNGVGHAVTLYKQKLLSPIKPDRRKVRIPKANLPKRKRPTRNLPDL